MVTFFEPYSNLNEDHNLFGNEKAFLGWKQQGYSHSLAAVVSETGGGVLLRLQLWMLSTAEEDDVASFLHDDIPLEIVGSCHLQSRKDDKVVADGSHRPQWKAMGT